MTKIYSRHLSEIWLKAAAMGSLWASFEIIIGSFLHNLRFPFAGTILSLASVSLIIAFIQVWRHKGLVWRAGLIAALLKSISPSAIILGPMIGIFSEALIIEFFILLLGRNLAGYMMGGAIAVFSALLHKIVSLLVTYGFDLIIIADEFYQFISRQIGYTEGDPDIIISIVVVIYMLAGAAGAVTGFMAGKKAQQLTVGQPMLSIPENQRSFFSNKKAKRSSPLMLLFHVICIPGCLYIINTLPLWYSFIPSLAYAGYCLYVYRASMRSFRKPSFWIWFMAISILAAVFWNGLTSGAIWEWEGLIVGLKMNVRAVVVLTGFAAISHELHNPIIRTVLYHNGFANIYHAVDLAFAVLPGMIDSLPGVKKILRSPVKALGLIVSKTSQVYPLLRREIENYNKVIILSGGVQQGKTSFLLKLVDYMNEQKFNLCGFVARGVHDNSRRIGYDLEDVTTKQQMQFVRDVPSAGAYRHGKYYFNNSGIEFGKECLNDQLAMNADLIIIDEIGPVELKGRGWAPEVERLLNTTAVPQLWVVRSSLLQKAIRQWSIGDVLLIDIEQDTPQGAIRDIKAFLDQ